MRYKLLKLPHTGMCLHAGLLRSDASLVTCYTQPVIITFNAFAFSRKEKERAR